MPTTNWWGVKRKIGPGHKLSPVLSSGFEDGEAVLGEADPMTVTIHGANIVTKHKTHGNDLLILSTTRFKDENTLVRVHFTGSDVEPGWVGSFFDDTILMTSDIKPEWNRLILQVQIYDLKGFKTQDLTKFASVAGKLVGSSLVLGSIAAGAAWTVPFMPLAFEAASAAGEAGAALASTIVKATQNLDNHNKILDEQIMLHISEPNVGDPLLQPGYFVCFSEELEDDREIHLHNLRKVVHADGAEFNECDYVVIEVSREATIDWKREIDEQTARLVSQVVADNSLTTETIVPLQETMEAADAFHRLQRLVTISNIPEKQRTDAQKELYKKLRSGDNEKLSVLLSSPHVSGFLKPDEES